MFTKNVLGMVLVEVTCVASGNALVKLVISPLSLPPRSTIGCLLRDVFLGCYLKAYEVYKGVPQESLAFVSHNHQHRGQQVAQNAHMLEAGS